MYWGTEPAGTSPTLTTTQTAYDPPAEVASGVVHTLRLRTYDQVANVSGWTSLFTLKFDDAPPTVSNLALNGQVLTAPVIITDTQPLITADFDDPLPGSGIDVDAVTLRLNGVDITPTSVTTTGFTFTPPTPLLSDEYQVRVRVNDLAGNVSNQPVIDFTLDGTPPALENLTLTIINPPPDEQLYATGLKLYYGPQASGQFEVGVYAYDDYFGLETLTFPSVFTDDGLILKLDGETQPDTYTHAYTVVASQTVAADFRLRAWDVLSNTDQSEPFRVEKDSTGPALTGLSLSVTTAGDPQYLYTRQTPPAFYYHPTASGTLTLTVTAADSQSGLDQVTFPHIFTAGDGKTLFQTGQAGPQVFSRTYTLDGSAALSQSLTVTASDKVENLATSQSFPVVQDAISPTVVITVPDRASLIFDITCLSWLSQGAGRDLANAAGAPGAGIRHYDVQYRNALTTTCLSWRSQGRGLLTQTISTTTQFMGRIGQDYYFQIRATDNVSNTGVWVEAGPVVINGVTKYYHHGGTRVAMRQGDEVYYLHGDHLGSTSLTTDSSGAVVSEVRYLPYGEERWTNEVASPADFGFTSQRREGFGLYDYNARYYSPYLGRFLSPDTVIPNLADSQAWNRYSYVSNNPKI